MELRARKHRKHAKPDAKPKAISISARDLALGGGGLFAKAQRHESCHLLSTRSRLPSPRPSACMHSAKHAFHSTRVARANPHDCMAQQPMSARGLPRWNATPVTCLNTDLFSHQSHQSRRDGGSITRHNARLLLSTITCCVT